MSSNHDQFYVGINVFLMREGKLLLGKRKNTYQDGTWGLPGGHLEHGESMIACGIREVEEETGIKVTALEFVNVANWPRSEKIHYVQFAFLAKDPVGEPELMESDKCYEWQWFDLDSLPENQFDSHQGLITLFKEKSLFGDKRL